MRVFCTEIGGCPCIIDAINPLDIGVHVRVHDRGVLVLSITHASVRARAYASYLSSVRAFFG